MTIKTSKTACIQTVSAVAIAVAMASVIAVNAAGPSFAQAAPDAIEDGVPGKGKAVGLEKKDDKGKNKGNQGKAKGKGKGKGKPLNENDRKDKKLGGGGEGHDSPDKGWRESRQSRNVDPVLPTRSSSLLRNDVAGGTDLAPSRSIRPSSRPSTRLRS